jgi:hypothetical protein
MGNRIIEKIPLNPALPQKEDMKKDSRQNGKTYTAYYSSAFSRPFIHKWAMLLPGEAGSRLLVL